MNYDDYLRDESREIPKTGRTGVGPLIKNELLEFGGDFATRSPTILRIA